MRKYFQNFNGKKKILGTNCMSRKTGLYKYNITKKFN